MGFLKKPGRMFPHKTPEMLFVVELVLLILFHVAVQGRKDERNTNHQKCHHLEM
jgi:hypothetical protein